MQPWTTEEPAFEPVPERCATTGASRVRLLARVQVPLTLTVRPWARLYELPDGRRFWCVRIWEDGRPVHHCVAPWVLRRYARRSGLRELAAELRTAEGGSRGA
jgi:hypothetical protein